MKSALSSTLEESANAIKRASERLVAHEVTKCLQIINDCYERKSKVLISGVGKSGIIARKMAATFWMLYMEILGYCMIQIFAYFYPTVAKQLKLLR